MIAVDDVSVVDEDSEVVIDVQANDLNIGGGDETTFLFSDPVHGELELLDNDSIRYIPNSDYNGIDTFSYEVCNGEEPIPSCDIALVIVTVNPIPDVPIAINDTVETNIQTPILVDVLENDTNFDAEGLEPLIVSDPAHGLASVIGSNIQYTPNDLFTGPDSLQYAACKIGSSVFCDTAWLFIDVLQLNFFAPEAMDDQYEVSIGSETLLDVLANDTDADGDELFIQSLDFGLLNGVVEIVDNNLLYLAVSSGNDSLEYVVCDVNIPSLCDTAKVSVAVIDVRVPNSFSPNSDGINDVLQIQGLDSYPGFTFSVYNRYGQIVYVTTDPVFQWDGSVNQDSFLPSGIVNDGTYFYVLDLGGGLKPETGMIVIKK